VNLDIQNLKSNATEMDAMGVKVGILNAGDGQHEHPSQLLLDLLTICGKIDRANPHLALLKNKKIAIVGDILHSHVARSNIWSLKSSASGAGQRSPSRTNLSQRQPHPTMSISTS
jgi:aspartate carbamoyltransferase catalytic subunit